MSDEPEQKRKPQPVSPVMGRIAQFLRTELADTHAPEQADDIARRLCVRLGLQSEEAR